MIKNSYTYEASSEPKSLAFLLHGVGSNGQDLISLAPYFAQALPHTLFISPDAPFVCDMMPPGYPNAYQWFSLQDRNPEKMLEGVKTAAPLVQSYITQERKKYNIPANKCALIGFSQGTMTSLYAGPRYEEPLAGILGYSGALIWDEKTKADTLNKMPIHLIHGEADDVVPVEAFANAKNTLTAHNFEVSGYTQPGLTHSIDQKGIENGTAFLKSIL